MPHSTLSKQINDILLLISEEKLHVASYEKELQNLLARLEQGHFHLAVLGQFKRGKSTLLNSLVGYQILPSSVIPLTAIPTFIYYSKTIKVKVVFISAKESFEEATGNIETIGKFLINYVTEEHNPKNKYNVAKVELYLPSPILKDGFIFIDTPGIGSTHKHNTEMTLNFLPQCDAALFVTSADPPITEVEIDFLKRVKSIVSKIIFILNKIDYLDEDEIDTSINFFIKVLKEQAGINLEKKDIYPVSAKRALKGKLNNNPELLKQSNIETIEKYLNNFLLKEKTEVLQIAIRKKALDTLTGIITEINIQIKSYKMPINELEDKISLLSEEIEKINTERLYINDMLKGDKGRIEKFLDEETEKLRVKATDFFIEKIKNVFKTKDFNEIKSTIQKTLEIEIPPYFEKEFGIFSNKFNKHTSEILAKYENKANSLIELIRKNAMKLMDIEYIPTSSKEGLKMKIKPYWVVNKWETTLDFITNTIMDSMLPKSILEKKLQKRFFDKVGLLINSNIENLHWSIFQGIQDTFRQFLYEFDLQMQEVVRSTKGAVERALKIKKNESHKIKNEIETLEQLLEKLKNYKNKLLENQ